MKLVIPEISWHNRDPVLSVHFQPVADDGYYRLATGGSDSHVFVSPTFAGPKGAAIAHEWSCVRVDCRLFDVCFGFV